MGNGEQPTSKDGTNLGPVIFIFDWVLFTITTIIVLLRLFTRIWITRNPGWDDAVIALSQALNSVGKALTCLQIAHGLGRHRDTISPRDYTKYLRYDYFDWAQFLITLALGKISICLFLLRLSQFKKIRKVLQGVIYFVVVTHVPLLLVSLLQCHPVNRYWDQNIAGTCFSRESVRKIIITQGVISILIDFVCATFPIVLLRKTKIDSRTKTGLCLLMGLGYITAIACVVRTVFSGELRSPDISWVGVPNAIARIIEVNLGNIAACMPLMKPLVRYMRAQISGKDIPETLRPTRSPTIPRSRWDIRFWTPRTHRGTAGAEDQRVWPSRAKSRPLIDDHQPLKQPYRTGARLAPVKDGAPNSESLELPMQGQSEEDCTDVIDFKSYPTKRDQKIYGDVTERWDQPENV